LLNCTLTYVGAGRDRCSPRNLIKTIMNINDKEHEYEKPDRPIPASFPRKAPNVNQHGGDEKWYQ